MQKQETEGPTETLPEKRQVEASRTGQKHYFRFLTESEDREGHLLISAIKELGTAGTVLRRGQKCY